ncbi:MAG: phosphopantothenoylcysteine decarboxylase [Verrucomicrobia bacterium]|nr:phosphopantothenoylcysteine decarboxylase [Verrucomicrobiota bacterium]
MAEKPSHIVILGVTGSIAAFRAADLASAMVKEGWEVHAIMTANGARFLTPLTLAALTHQPVHTSLWEERDGGGMTHLDLAEKAGAIVVAPASADFLAQAAHGLAGDVLGAVLLATQAPVLFAPAMNTHMWQHPATQANVKILQTRGNHLVGPSEGRLACGAEGPGRMAPVAEIMEQVKKLLKENAWGRKKP